MEKKYKVLGLKIELTGLAFVFIATFWQGIFSGWWDTQSSEWQYWIQEEVNISQLSVLADIVDASLIDDPELRKNVALRASQKAKEAIGREVDMREERKNALKGQASLFSTIRLILVLIGAFLLIIGKYLSIRAEKE